jgi:hypothetical protein
MANPVPPIPPNPVSNEKVWRDWFTSLRDAVTGVKATTNVYDTMYGNGVAITVTIGSINTYYAVPTGLLHGASSGGAFYFNTSSLTCITAGTYSVTWSLGISQASASSQLVAGSLMINGTALSTVTGRTTLTAAATIQTISGTSVISLAVGDLLQFCVSTGDAATDVVVNNANLTLIRMST